jgi:hypothetical protein
MAKGFRLVDAEVGWRPRNAEGWWIARVEATLTRPKTVTLVMQQSEGEVATVTLTGITSFRVQDEREMVDYWQQMQAEGVARGRFYTIETSDYLNDLAGGVSPLAHQQVQYLVLAEEECVDFLGPGWGVIPMKIDITFYNSDVR